MQVLVRDLFISVEIIVVIQMLYCLIGKKQKILSWYSFAVIIYTLFMVVIFSLTGVSPISGFHTNGLFVGINFVPFSGIAEIMSEGWNFYSVANIFGNILMFAPVGFFAPMLYKKNSNVFKTIGAGVLVSLWIEGSQLFLARGTDIDDIILNTLGALIGFICYLIFTKIFKKITEKITQSYQAQSIWTFIICMLVPYVVIIIGGFYDRYVFMSASTLFNGSLICHTI